MGSAVCGRSGGIQQPWETAVHRAVGWEGGFRWELEMNTGRNCSGAWLEGSPDSLRCYSWEFFVLMYQYVDTQGPRARSQEWSPSSVLCVESRMGLQAADASWVYGKQFSWIFCLSFRMTYQVGSYCGIFFAVINSSLSRKASKLVCYFPQGEK